MAGDFETIDVRISGGVATIVLNRPQRANSITIAMCHEITAAQHAIEADPTNRVIVLTGAGRHFCGGADLTAIQDGDEPSNADFIDSLWASPLPVIAAINGAATGGGFELSLACDLRIMAAEAFVSLPEVRFGALPVGGGTQRASRLVGPGVAKELLFFGDRLSASEALAKGLVTKVVPLSELEAVVQEAARALIRHPAYALTLAKRAVNEGLDLPLADGLALEKRLGASITPEMMSEAQQAVASADPVYGNIFKR